jgi:GNAT superfamily N-acetyltransferase
MPSLDTLDTTPTSFVHVSPTDPRAAVLLADLEREYDERYSDLRVEDESAEDEINRYPADRFLPPDGAFVLLLEGDEVVAGGAFMRFLPDEETHALPSADAEAAATTVEFKRIWTHRDHRRRGLSRRVLRELEAEASRRGYTRVFLTTGPRQPEAQNLYRTEGYTVLPLAEVYEGFIVHPFEKRLPTAAQ